MSDTACVTRGPCPYPERLSDLTPAELEALVVEWWALFQELQEQTGPDVDEWLEAQYREAGLGNGSAEPVHLRAQPARGHVSRREIERVQILEGRRNVTLTRIAGALRRHGCAEATIVAALTVVNADRCRPPLEAGELARIAARVSRYAPAALTEGLAPLHGPGIRWGVAS